MKFEVNIAADLDALHKAREAHNAANPESPAADMPAFVQQLTDDAVAAVLQPLGPTTLPAAMARIAELEASNATLSKEIAALSQVPVAPAEVKPG